MLDLINEIVVPTPLIELHSPLFSSEALRVYIKADYLTHPLLSGNKWRKLKYNLLEADKQGFKKIISFGGAYSNHIYALAEVAKLTNFEVHIAVRGDELTSESNSTLKYAHACGVQLHFVSRKEYRNKEEIATQFGDDYFLIPEGGTNRLSLLGTSEVVDEILSQVKADYIVGAMGTAGTVSGFLTNHTFRGKVIGIPVLKGGLGLITTVNELTKSSSTNNFEILPDYHFGGYGKVPAELKEFIANFRKEFNIELDEIYTSKLCFAVLDLISKKYFSPNTDVIIYHSGGLRP